MIYGLNGTPQQIRGNKLLLAVGPVTLELTMPSLQAAELRVGESAELSTYLHFSSQADQLKLFGFTSQVARDLFVMLISASGVGPGVAVNLLDLGVSALVQAIRGEDERMLTKAGGVGPKLAKKIILELGDKLDKEFAYISVDAPAAARQTGPFEDALQAIVALGFPRNRAESALAEVRADYGGDETVVLIRRMLAQLAG